VWTTTLDTSHATKVEVPAKSLRVLVLDEVDPDVETREIEHLETSGSGVISLDIDVSHSGVDGEVTVYAAPV
jgi:hypothetical protein